MACGCGKGKMARPASSTTRVTSASTAATPSSSARVVSAASPYTKQQNTAPAHLQENLRRTV